MRFPVALLLIATLAAAAPPPPAKAPDNRSVRVPLSFAFDGEAPALKNTDFDVSVDGSKPGRILRVRSPKDDLMLLVVLDLVGDLALVDPARAGLTAGIRNLPNTTWVGLLRSQDGLQVILDPTGDREKVAAAIAAVPITGKAGLLSTIETAVQLADSIAAKSAVRVAVVYITDSDIRNYREDFTNPVINTSDSRDLSRRFPEGLVREKVSKLNDTLSRCQTPVFIAHLWYSNERLNEAYQSGLMQLTSATGGSALFARSSSDVAAMVERAVTAAQSQYSVLVQLPPHVPKIVNLSVRSGERQLEYRSRFVLR